MCPRHSDAYMGAISVTPPRFSKSIITAAVPFLESLSAFALANPRIIAGISIRACWKNSPVTSHRLSRESPIGQAP